MIINYHYPFISLPFYFFTVLFWDRFNWLGWELPKRNLKIKKKIGVLLIVYIRGETVYLCVDRNYDLTSFTRAGTSFVTIVSIALRSRSGFCFFLVYKSWVSLRFLPAASSQHRRNMWKHVPTRRNILQHVKTCRNLLIVSTNHTITWQLHAFDPVNWLYRNVIIELTRKQ